MSATMAGGRVWSRARAREAGEEAAGGRRGPLVTVGLALFALVWLVPFFFVVTTAIRGQGELLSSGPFSIPKELRLDNFAEAWDIGNFSTYYRNSLIVTGLKGSVTVAANPVNTRRRRSALLWSWERRVARAHDPARSSGPPRRWVRRQWRPDASKISAAAPPRAASTPRSAAACARSGQTGCPPNVRGARGARE